MIVMWLVLTVPWARLQFMIGAFPDYTHLIFGFMTSKHVI